jgi:dienelactone hydrolase
MVLEKWKRPMGNLPAGRLEIVPLASRTVTTSEFLTNQRGQQVTLAAILAVPKAATPMPAVVLLHDSGGLNASHLQWAAVLDGMGVATLLIDSFAGRGITDTIVDQSLLSQLSMIVDAHAGLRHLAADPRVDPHKIAIMGFSRGSVASIYSATRRFSQLRGVGLPEFAAHIGFYTPCNVQYIGDTDVSGAPLLFLHGDADDYVPISWCRRYVERLRSRGAHATLVDLKGARHKFDDASLAESEFVGTGETSRNCDLRELEDGRIINVMSGLNHDQSDPCLERGAHVGYDSAAHKRATMEIRSLIQRVSSNLIAA